MTHYAMALRVVVPNSGTSTPSPRVASPPIHSAARTMDLMLVMNERLRHLGLEQRAATQRIALLSVVGAVFFVMGLLASNGGTAAPATPAGGASGGATGSGSGSGKLEPSPPSGATSTTSGGGSSPTGVATGSSTGTALTALCFTLANAALIYALQIAQMRTSAVAVSPWAGGSYGGSLGRTGGHSAASTADLIGHAYHLSIIAGLLCTYAGVSVVPSLALLVLLQVSLFAAKLMALQRRQLIAAAGAGGGGAYSNA